MDNVYDKLFDLQMNIDGHPVKHPLSWAQLEVHDVSYIILDDTSNCHI